MELKKHQCYSLYTYEKYINEIYLQFDNNTNNYDVTKTLNSNMHILNDNYDDYNSFVINNKNLKKQRFKDILFTR